MDLKERKTLSIFNDKWGSRRLIVLPGGREIVSTVREGVKIWTLSNGKEIRFLKGHRGLTRACSLSPDSTQLVTGGEDKTIKIWNLCKEGNPITLFENDHTITALAFTSDGKKIVLSDNRTLKVLNIYKKSKQSSNHISADPIQVLEITKDCSAVIACYRSRYIKLFDLISNNLILSIQVSQTGIVGIQPVSNPKLFLTGLFQEQGEICELQTGQVIRTILGHTGKIRSACFTTDGNKVLTASEDGTVKVWKTVSGRLESSLETSSGGATAVSLSNDDKLALVAYDDCSLKLWDLERIEIIDDLKDCSLGICAVAMIPGNRVVAVTLLDNQLNLIDFGSGAILTHFNGDSTIWACTVTPDGKTILAGDELGRIHFLKLEEGSTQPFITRKPNKFFFPEPEIGGNKTLMSLNEITLKRLKDLEELLSVQYRKLSAFQKDLGITASTSSKFELEERIRQEIFPRVMSHAKEYIELIRQIDDQPRMAKMVQLLASIRSQLESLELPEQVQEIDRLLRSPNTGPISNLSISNPQSSSSKGEIMKKVVVELDLVGYSSISSIVEQNDDDPKAVFRLNQKIQEIIDQALQIAGCSRSETVMSTTGDGAILVFDQPNIAHIFAQEVHRITKERNQGKTELSSLRLFRIGAATGDIVLQPRPNGGYDIAGTAIARAVRLEGAANPGEFVVDLETFSSLAPNIQSQYHPEEQVKGKRDEIFSARRCPMYLNVPNHIGAKPVDGQKKAPLVAQPKANRREILELFGELSPRDQIDKLLFLLEVPLEYQPSKTLSLADKEQKLLEYMASRQNGLERVIEELCYLLGRPYHP